MTATVNRGLGHEMTQYRDPPLLIVALMAPEISGALRWLLTARGPPSPPLGSLSRIALVKDKALQA